MTSIPKPATIDQPTTPAPSIPPPIPQGEPPEGAGAGGVTLLDRAAAFAAAVHEGQYRSGGTRPYIVHPLSVCRRLRDAGVTDEATLAAAVLHDVMEDCGVSRARLAEHFGSEVADIVAELTDPEGMPKVRVRQWQVDHAPSLSPKAKLVKLADKLDNVSDTVARPPKWRPGSIAGYARTARAVVAGLGVNLPKLEAEFEEAFEAAIALDRPPET